MSMTMAMPTEAKALSNKREHSKKSSIQAKQDQEMKQAIQESIQMQHQEKEEEENEFKKGIQTFQAGNVESKGCG